jgi:peroxiredoxin
MSSLADGPAANSGERYVGFTLPDIETGRPVSLSDFHGKKVLLIQFASW